MKERESIYRTAMRTHACGELTAEHADAAVVLCGWVASRRDHGGVTFIDLRDREGIVQVVFHPEEAADAHSAAQRLGSEDVVRVSGAVRAAPRRDGEPSAPDGEIEVAAGVSRGALGGGDAARSRSRTGSRPGRSSASDSATSICADPR